MLENLVQSIRDERALQQRVTTRRYHATDGSQYIVTLPNWRWRVVDQSRTGDKSIQMLFDQVLHTTAIWRRCRPMAPAGKLFKECLEDQVDFDAYFLFQRKPQLINDNFRAPWMLRVGKSTVGGQGER
jgi:hypothetical protein